MVESWLFKVSEFKECNGRKFEYKIQMVIDGIPKSRRVGQIFPRPATRTAFRTRVASLLQSLPVNVLFWVFTCEGGFGEA